MSYTHNGIQAAKDDLREIQEKVVEGRREFFKQVGQGAVATAMATTAMHMGVRDYMKPVVEGATASANPNGGWKNLFSLKPNYLYMNVGTTGSTPTQVLDQYENWFVQNAWQCKSYVSTTDYCIDVASAFGANPSEFIMSFTTTDGMLKTLAGVKWPWQPNSVAANVLTTNMEHSGGLGPLYCQINRNNIKTPSYDMLWVNRLTGEQIAGTDMSVAPNAKAIPAVLGGEMIQTPTGIRKNATEMTGFPLPEQVSGHPDEYLFNTMIKPALDEALARVGGTAQMLMFSSPPYLTGVRYPEKQMCLWAAAKGITTSIDGAHLTGMININLHDMGVDLFAGSGHKWQCGPGQTGIAYVRNGKPGDEAWTFTNNAGMPVSGTASTYSNSSELPLFWCYNDTFRMSKWVDADSTVRRPMVNGWRNPADNIGQLIQSIGNNSIQMNRALYETMMLWNKIGRANIDNYVCTLAQYLRWQLSIAPWANGANKAVADNSLYALSTEFRKVNRGAGNTQWADVWHPINDAANYPVYARCGLTTWNPMYYVGNDGLGAPDFNFPLSAGDRTVQSSRSSAIITYMNNRHGIYIRNTNCPNILRFPNPAAGVNTTTVYSGNATTQKGATNSSQPFRLSTHLFHDMADLDAFLNAWATDTDMQAMLNLGATQDSATA